MKKLILLLLLPLVSSIAIAEVCTKDNKGNFLNLPCSEIDSLAVETKIMDGIDCVIDRTSGEEKKLIKLEKNLPVQRYVSRGGLPAKAGKLDGYYKVTVDNFEFKIILARSNFSIARLILFPTSNIGTNFTFNGYLPFFDENLVPMGSAIGRGRSGLFTYSQDDIDYTVRCDEKKSFDDYIDKH